MRRSLGGVRVFDPAFFVGGAAIAHASVLGSRDRAADDNNVYGICVIDRSEVATRMRKETVGCYRRLPGGWMLLTLVQGYMKQPFPQYTDDRQWAVPRCWSFCTKSAHLCTRTYSNEEHRRANGAPH